MTLSPLTDNRPDTHSCGHLVAGDAQARRGPLDRPAIRTTNATQAAVRSFTAARSSNLRANTIAESAAAGVSTMASLGYEYLQRCGLLEQSRQKH